MSDGQTEACEGSPLPSGSQYFDEIANLVRLLRLIDQFESSANTDYRGSNLDREVTRTLDRYRGIR